MRRRLEADPVTQKANLADISKRSKAKALRADPEGVRAARRAVQLKSQQKAASRDPQGFRERKRVISRTSYHKATRERAATGAQALWDTLTPCDPQVIIEAFTGQRSGFRGDRPATLYLLHSAHLGETQIGISNVFAQRLRQHNKNGGDWVVISREEYPLGEEALKVERRVKDKLKTYNLPPIIRGDGTEATENWKDGDLPAFSSLQELILWAS